MSLWPFRTGNDDRFQTTPEESIYDPIKSQLPPHRYEIEVDNYLEWRSRRGFLQSVFPVACYGAIAGFVIGFRQSRVDGRYIGRYKVMWRYTSTMAMVGLFTSGIHHYMIVRNDYKDKFFYPVLSGTMGAVAVTLIGQMGNTGQGVFVGSFIGILYALGCYGMNYYHRRRLRIFLQQQQIQQVPVHKVSPELQRMYRAFLFDHRPLEDSDVARREAVILSRGAEDDTRLDAQTFMNNMAPEVFDWVNFPDWWPLKWPLKTEEDQMLLERQREEEVARRTAAFLTTDDGGLLKRKNRAKQHRDV